MLTISLLDNIPLMAFWLTFTRWVTVLFQLPLFDHIGIPSLIKILTALLISFSFYPYTKQFVINDIIYIGENHFWILTIYYSVVGLLIGLLVRSIMHIYVAAGTLMTQSIGFGAVRYFDPNLGQSVGPLEKLIKWSMLVIILSSGALRPMIEGIIFSFDKFGLKGFNHLSLTSHFFLDFFKTIFKSSLILASPLIFTNILVASILGITTRTVPQMNILMVSFVVNIGIGLFVFFCITSEFFVQGNQVYIDHLAAWFKFLKG